MRGLHDRIVSMKVVIQSNSGPFALSRHAVAAATSVLPARIVRRVAKLMLVGDARHSTPFEYHSKERIATFCFPANPHDSRARDRALRELLIGLASLEPDPAGDDVETFVGEWLPRCVKAITEAGNKPRPPHARRLMYIEYKGEGIVGPARIGWVRFSKSGKSLEYRGKTFQSLAGSGFKANYFDVETGEQYWISGCKKDGTDALYSTTIEIDEDAREEYWVGVRGLPENKTLTSVRCVGKYR
jgi:hypothetical protein